jgi:hypothetical protein
MFSLHLGLPRGSLLRESFHKNVILIFIPLPISFASDKRETTASLVTLCFVSGRGGSAYKI